MAPSVSTTSVISFCIVAILLITVLRFTLLNRVSLHRAYSDIRAKYDKRYAERRVLEQEQWEIQQLEAQRALIAAHAARTRMWYGYQFNDGDENQRAGPVRNLPALDVTLTASEVDENFPSKLFQVQDKGGLYVSSTTTDPGQKIPTAETVEDNKAQDTTAIELRPTKRPGLPSENDIPANACMVCLEAMRNDDMTKLLTCGHLYHAPCITEWLVCHKAVCPLCRYEYNALHRDDNTEANAQDSTTSLSTSPQPGQH